MWERLVYAATTAALIYFGGAQTIRKEEVKADRFADLENYREFIIETMQNCTCEE
jgi:hypothetical protein